ncbi:MAG: hypothetical protein Q8J99_02945 [Sulfuritalea sp.]|nr:hypothetical protein [Sulfuritalea sp.]
MVSPVEDGESRIDRVLEDVIDGVLVPPGAALQARRRIERHRYRLRSVPLQIHGKHVPHHAGLFVQRRQALALSLLDGLIPEWHAPTIGETVLGIFHHAALGVGADLPTVALVDQLEDAIQEPAIVRVYVEVAGDIDEARPVALQLDLEVGGVEFVPGEATGAPYDE